MTMPRRKHPHKPIMSFITADRVARFWSRVIVLGEDDCWLFVSRLAPAMRPSFELLQVNRFSWALHHGSDPGHLMVCHSCDTPHCVNPKHLWLGTHDDNMADAKAKGRMGRFNHSRPGDVYRDTPEYKAALMGIAVKRANHG